MSLYQLHSLQELQTLPFCIHSFHPQGPSHLWIINITFQRESRVGRSKSSLSWVSGPYPAFCKPTQGLSGIHWQEMLRIKNLYLGLRPVGKNKFLWVKGERTWIDNQKFPCSKLKHKTFFILVLKSWMQEGKAPQSAWFPLPHDEWRDTDPGYLHQLHWNLFIIRIFQNIFKFKMRGNLDYMGTITTLSYQRDLFKLKFTALVWKQKLSIRGRVSSKKESETSKYLQFHMMKEKKIESSVIFKE